MSFIIEKYKRSSGIGAFGISFVMFFQSYIWMNCGETYVKKIIFQAFKDVNIKHKTNITKNHTTGMWFYNIRYWPCTTLGAWQYTLYVRYWPCTTLGAWQYTLRGVLLERWYDYRTIDWANQLEYPEFTNKEVNRFLNYLTPPPA